MKQCALLRDLCDAIKQPMSYHIIEFYVTTCHDYHGIPSLCASDIITCKHISNITQGVLNGVVPFEAVSGHCTISVLFIVFVSVGMLGSKQIFLDIAFVNDTACARASVCVNACTPKRYLHKKESIIITCESNMLSHACI